MFFICGHDLTDRGQEQRPLLKEEALQHAQTSFATGLDSGALYLGLYWDNGKENGNHYSRTGIIWLP